MRKIGLAFATSFLILSKAYAANLVANGNFDGGIQGWSVSGSCQPFYDEVVGSPDAGSLGVNCLGPAATSVRASQCVVIPTGSRLDFSARWTVNFTVPGSGAQSFGYTVFAGIDCTGANLGSFVPNTTEVVSGNACCGALWSEVSLRGQSVSPLARSALVRLGAGVGDVIVFDHIVLEPTIVVFTDGFETAGNSNDT